MPEMRDLLTFQVPTTAAGYLDLTAEQLDTIFTSAVAAAAPLRDKGPDEITDDELTTLRELAEAVTNVRDAKKKAAKKADEFANADEIFTPADATEVVEGEIVDGKAVTAAVRVSDLKDRKAPSDVVPVGNADEKWGVLLAAGDVTGVNGYNNLDDLAPVIEKRVIANTGRQTGYNRAGVAVFKREFPTELTQKAHGDDDQLLEFARREDRLPGGSVINSVEQQVKNGVSLTAAAGWCAPSQTVYDLFELEARTGTVDIPEVQISRGGLRFTPGPDFATIFAGTGYFHQTEAQVIAATSKPCMVVPCPSFTDVRLEVEGVCITGAILQSRGYPEAVARFVRGAMAVHYHKLNQFVIAQMVAGSTTVDLSPAPIAGSVVADDTSATTVLLSTIEMAVVDYRYRHRMPENAVLEAVFPIWTLAVLRADLSRRTGTELPNVTDAFLLSQMRMRGIRPQFVYDWQDSFAGLANSPGGASALQQFPQELEFLLYAPGTFVRGSADVITLDTVYDAANLALNQFTALFTEEGVLVAKLGHDARRYIVPFCPTGATSATVQMNCSA